VLAQLEAMDLDPPLSVFCSDFHWRWGGLPDGGGLHDRSAAAAARSAATRQGLQLRPLKLRVAGLELQGGYVHLDEPALASHGAGGARLLVEDDELEGAAVVAVLLSPDGRVIAQRRTVVGGEA
jgi:hypothetical protein